jgi:nucleotide-binding universal stress UspA family protein
MAPKVLIAVDGSELSIGAARQAAALVDQSAALTVITVVPPPVFPGAGPASGMDAGPIVTPETTEELDHALTDEARSALDRTVENLGRDAERLLVHGDPAAEICRVAEENGFDVIAVGSHGTGFVKRVFLGSVSHHVLNHAPCPVLVVREAARD